jgi:hypothetical protein
MLSTISLQEHDSTSMPMLLMLGTSCHLRYILRKPDTLGLYLWALIEAEDPYIVPQLLASTRV